MSNKHENLQIVNSVMEKLETTGGAVVSDYADWFFISGLVWVTVGLAAIITALKWKPEVPDHSDAPLLYPLARFSVGAIGLVIIGCNLPDVFHPSAMATHQLLSDIF